MRFYRLAKRQARTFDEEASNGSDLSFPNAPTSLYDGPVLKDEGGREFSLRFSFENEDGEIEKMAFRFPNVWAYKCNFLFALDRKLMKLSYGRLVSLDATSWLAEIDYQDGQYGASAAELKVFAITFDDGPSYQFLCKSTFATN
ncbi:hypothetical protein [Oryzifoliimicrobium ureilyticus]|uniref:hypothetical protein n=1 Tax=Oryzifoliimicrobium ureilyticus TaxID=3113724 RepID=UPI0030766FDD